jgi:hypothetical protein
MGLFFISGSSALAADDSCLDLLRDLFKTRNQHAAEEIMKQYEPFRTEGFALTSLFESQFNSVYRGIHPSRPSAPPFVVKVSPLHEALNDYVALRALRKAQEKATAPIKIVKGTLLTPRTGELQLTTPVIQINEYLEGRPLIEILADPKVDLLRKTVLKSRFRAWVDEIKPGLIDQKFDAFRHEAEAQFFQKHSRLLKKDPDILATMPGLLMAEKPWILALKDRSSFTRHLEHLTQGNLQELAGMFEDVQIIVKPDNIIVNEANEFILFDPF